MGQIGFGVVQRAVSKVVALKRTAKAALETGRTKNPTTTVAMPEWFSYHECRRGTVAATILTRESRAFHKYLPGLDFHRGQQDVGEGGVSAAGGAGEDLVVLGCTGY